MLSAVAVVTGTASMKGPALHPSVTLMQLTSSAVRGWSESAILPL